VSTPSVDLATLPDGWMTEAELLWHAQTAERHQRIIEVGVWKGRTTLVLAEHSPGRIWAVDHFGGVPMDPVQQDVLYAEAEAENGPTKVCAEFCANLAPYIETGRVVPVFMDSLAAADHLLAAHGATFDWIFIDGDHRYESVRRDIEAYRRLLAPGGLLSGHDLHWKDVRRAVDDLVPGWTKPSGTRIWTVTP
jgi:SAM-dependent methyltransferase